MRSLIIIALTTLFLSACAGKSTVSENQCAVGDWQMLGYRDGVNGYRSSRLLEHQDACMEHGIAPKRSEYMIGWNDGAREYCEPTNGFHVGERGWQHNNICPADLRAGFLQAFKQGQALYQARADVANLEAELDQKTNRLATVKSEIVAVGAAQLNSELTATERVDLATRMQRLFDERRRLKNEIPQVEQDLAVKSRELDRISQTLASAD